MRYIQESCNTTSYFLSCLEKQSHFLGAIMIRHILLLKFTPEIKEQQLMMIRDTAISMQHQISGISAVEWGSNVSSENKNKGFTHAITMTFDDQKAISNYLSHPKHDKLKDLLIDSVNDIIVFDYEI
ncbi:Dabb family protein [Photorhabdus caribbeanensis]|nr:Dabb family protein [Photorhabdus caribbeanensis]